EGAHRRHEEEVVEQESAHAGGHRGPPPPPHAEPQDEQQVDGLQAGDRGEELDLGDGRGDHDRSPDRKAVRERAPQHGGQLTAQRTPVPWAFVVASSAPSRRTSNAPSPGSMLRWKTPAAPIAPSIPRRFPSSRYCGKTEGWPTAPRPAR